MKPYCQAQSQGQEFFCPECKTRWDMNDTDPPVCGRTVLARKEVSKRLNQLKEKM